MKTRNIAALALLLATAAFAQQPPPQAAPQLSKEDQFHLRALNDEIGIAQQQYLNAFNEKQALIKQINDAHPGFAYQEGGPTGGGLYPIPPAPTPATGGHGQPAPAAPKPAPTPAPPKPAVKK